ncbi:hypothetical protein NSTC731_00748 [Nostoc sp. DSM 114167]|jgi:hypothetical protein
MLCKILPDRSKLSVRNSALCDMTAIAGKANEDRDYRYKRSEYAARGIAEYWIVDPQINTVTVLILVDGFYEETRFVGNSAIASTIFPELQLTAEQVLKAGESNAVKRQTDEIILEVRSYSFFA